MASWHQGIVDRLASKTGIAAIAEQQFEVAKPVVRHGLIPILGPEALIKRRNKAESEPIFRDELLKGLDGLTGD